MLSIKVLTETDESVLRPGADELVALVRRIGGDRDHFLVVQRVPDLPDQFIQVWHDAGEEYQLEYRDGGHDRHYGTRVPAARQVADAMCGWARQQDGWDAGLAWERLDMPEPEPVPPLADEVREPVEEMLREQVLCGYATRQELVSRVEDFTGGSSELSVSQPQASELVDRLWLERVAEQAGWDDEETDPERVERVFAGLEETGITARPHFADCRGCGLAEIGGVRPGARGFVFFHWQSTEAAAAGHGLMLHYGGFDGSEETTAAIGREVSAALADAGLGVEWDGDPGQGIAVQPLDWRKRLVG
ncbi:hypothetical protein G5C51_17165 [Streptomyces sp. A7024]|uniref:DUF6891 domain-containing protein n=1 Tax=Streptomyces coryli TaxID=1128680 RepID=A0A6G4U0V2_9ACTN|nr:hypothetical protein [Streptomyces coryli]NGN65622.1 hypothetical protein [Streptomyces coryli]